MQPDPAELAKLEPDARNQRLAAIELARVTMPEQLEAACDQDRWSELRRRCALAATTIDDVASCR